MSQRKVLINRQALLDYTENFQQFKDVPFPELEGKFGCEKGTVPILKIKAASLDDQIRASNIAEKALVGGLKLIQNLASRNKNVSIGYEQLSKELNAQINDKTHIEITLFHKCCVQPQFSLLEAVKISEALPAVINRVASTALQLSSMEKVNGDY